jgi:hypothetical protein
MTFKEILRVILYLLTVIVTLMLILLLRNGMPVRAVKTLEPVNVVQTVEKSEPSVELEKIEEPKPILYDVPLDEELQLHIIKVCEENGIEPEIIFAMAYRESRYKVDAVGDSGASVGLLQIQKRWHSGRMEKLGCTDLADPYQNVIVGVDFLAELLDRYGDMGKALTAYNRGSFKGTVTEYATSIMTMANELRETKNVQN